MRAILTYHSIDPSGSPISVTAEQFGAHLRWLGSGAVRVVPLAELPALDPGEDAVALTFDDGFVNYSAEAAPLLEQYRVPATLFVVAGHAGGDNAWGGRRDGRVPCLPLLDWDQLGRLAERGTTLGAHTRTHPHLPALPPARLEDELSGAAETIAARTGRRPEQFAYPYGEANPTVVETARRVYRLACTTEFRPLAPADDPLRLPRLDMYYFREPGRLEAWGSAAFRRRLRVRSQLRRLRATLTGEGRSW